ncbi:MAG: hypothetical protein JWM95_4659 [Gemmatimonadetes bacterium]|nr:hypothetical protein [Gemmatimonadota bacterium]
MVCAAASATAQGYRLTRADSLIDEGRWTEAEGLFYSQSQRAPRNPVMRAALGRYIAMKGAVRTGMVLIEEAQRFGLDESEAQTILAPLRAVLEWRASATMLHRDSTLSVRPPSSDDALFQIPFPRTDSAGRVLDRTDVSEVVWHDVVDRGIGLDSLRTRSRPIGIEVFEAFVPSLDVRKQELTLHTNGRSALSATGKRYSVMRTAAGVKVLVGDRRVLSLPAALRELSPAWWQLDLVHGILVVR